MDAVLVRALIFGSGIFTQSMVILLINRQFKKNIKEILKVLIVTLISTPILIFLDLLNSEEGLSFSDVLTTFLKELPSIINISFIIYTIYFGLIFIKKILPVIQERTILIFTILFWYIYLPYSVLDIGQYNDMFFAIAIVLTTFSVAISLFVFTIPKFLRLVQYIWYLIITVSFSVILDVNLLEIIKGNYLVDKISNFDLFLSGYIGFFIIINIFYLYFFIPIPSKHQTFKERIEIWTDYVTELISKYDNYQLKPIYSVLYIIILSFLLYLNTRYEILSKTLTVSIVIAIVTLIDSVKNSENSNIIKQINK